MNPAFVCVVIAAGTLAVQAEGPAVSSSTAGSAATVTKSADLAESNRNAIALIRRAQEMSDDRYYEQAAELVRKSLSVAPTDFETRKIDVMVLLGRHEYTDALSEAKTLKSRTPDDVMLYGLLTDAYANLGDYKNAETSAQRMLNLRPGNLPAFVNAAHLREAFGEMDGAYDALNLAYQSTSPTASADRASLLTQMGRERRLAGKDEQAEKLLNQSLSVVPGYTAARRELAELYLHQNRYDDAVALFRQNAKAVPNARNTYLLAGALADAGQTEEANTLYAEFLSQALAESARKNNANRELVFYYADRAHQASKALEIAQQEYAWRQDIYTLDAYAWALHANGQDAEARKQMDVALAVGTRDPAIVSHSAQIKATASTQRP